MLDVMSTARKQTASCQENANTFVFAESQCSSVFFFFRELLLLFQLDWSYRVASHTVTETGKFNPHQGVHIPHAPII